jgi:hypothetical protein
MKRTAIFILTFALTGLVFGSVANAQVEGGAIAAIDEPSEGGGGGPSIRTVKSKAPATRKSKSIRTAAPSSKVVAVKPKPRKWDGFVIGDEYTFLNFAVVSAEKPYYTRAAKAAGASGLVQVEVLIETNGNVIWARARTGDKLLHPEAERAALASKFERQTVYGKPARATGFLVYRFESTDPAVAKSKARPCLRDSNGFKSPLREWTPKPFNSAEWLAGDRWLRARMRQDIFEKRIPNGKQRQEIANLFGEPNGKRTIEGREVWFYNINTGETDDIDMLAISFDAKGRAFAGLSKEGKVSMGALCGKIFPFDSSTF